MGQVFTWFVLLEAIIATVHVASIFNLTKSFGHRLDQCIFLH